MAAGREFQAAGPHADSEATSCVIRNDIHVMAYQGRSISSEKSSECQPSAVQFTQGCVSASEHTYTLKSDKKINVRLAI